MLFPISEIHFLLLSISTVLTVVVSYWIWKTKRSFKEESNLNRFIKWFSFALFLLAVNLVLHFLLKITGFVEEETSYFVCYVFFILAAFCFARAAMHLDELYKESDFMSLVKEKMQNQTEEFFEEAKE